MAKSKHRQLAIVRRLRGPRRTRTRIGMRTPILFAAIVIIAMVLDMCAFPPSRRNVVLAQTCNPAQMQWAVDARAVKTPPPVEKDEACQ
jgi:hypothetical protein